MTATLVRKTTAVGPSEIIKSGIVYRDFEIPKTAIDEDARTVELSFSSELEYERWFGIEILDHAKSSVRLGRLNGGGALLVDHDTRDHVGVVVKAEVGADRVGRAVVRFGKSQRADEIFNDVKDGIRKLVSVGYRIHKMILEKEEEDTATYRANDWEPYEISLVSVPADPGVGVGRAASGEEIEIEIEGKRQEIRQVEDKDKETNSPAPTVVVTVNESAVLEKERKRNTEILAMGAHWQKNGLEGAEAFARKHSGEGTSVDTFRGLLMEKLSASKIIRPAESPEIGMTEKEKRSFSFCRYMLHLAEPANAKFREAAAFEIECSRAAEDKSMKLPDRFEKHGKGNGGMIPTDIMRSPIASGMDEMRAGEMMQNLMRSLMKRDLSVGTATAGGHTVATDLLAASFIDILDIFMAVMGLNPTVLRDLNGNIAIPRQTGGATAFWVAEAAAGTESQQAFDQVTLSPKDVTAFTDYGRRLLMQSSIDVEAFVRMDLAKRLALAIDLASINGSGASNQPRGILNTSGIGSVAGGTNGLAPTWNHVVDLESAVANVNAAVGSLGYLTNTKVRGKLKRTEMFAGSNGRPVWDGNALNGYGAAVSNNVPSNLTKGTSSGVCSAIVFGNFSDLLIGMWGGLDVLVDPYSASSTGNVRVVEFQTVDVAVRHPESFAAMLDALTV